MAISSGQLYHLNLTATEVERALTQEYLLKSQIIHLALLMGALTFLTAAIFFYAQNEPNVGVDQSLLDTLSLVHVIYAFGTYSAAPFIFKRQLAGSAKDANPEENPALMFLIRVRTAQIIRLALFEGTAFLGLIVLMQGAINGILHVHPVYWWKVASTAILAGLIILTFPTKAKIMQLFNDRYGQY